MQNARRKKIKSKKEDNCFCLCQRHSIKAAFSFSSVTAWQTPVPPSVFPRQPPLHLLWINTLQRKFSRTPAPRRAHSHLSLLLRPVLDLPCWAKTSCPGSALLLFRGRHSVGLEFVVLLHLKDNEHWKLKGNEYPSLHLTALFRAGSDPLKILFQGFRKKEENPFSPAATFPSFLNTFISKTST